MPIPRSISIETPRNQGEVPGQVHLKFFASAIIEREVNPEEFKQMRDDQYTDCQLAAAAASYAVCGKDPKALKLMGVTAWPWRDYWWKPETYRRNLEKAGALILAEIERIDRHDGRTG